MRGTNITIIVSAPSGAGKTTIIDKLLSEDDRFEFVISTTSRKNRINEIDGKDYYFIPEDEFKKSIDSNEFIEWSVVHQNYYGITKKEFDRINAIGKIPIFDVDVQGAVKLKSKLEDAVFIFIIPPSFEVLKDRLVKRGTDSEDAIRVRFENAKNELKEIDIFDYIVVNDIIDDSVSDFMAIVKAEMCKDKKRALEILETLEEQFDNFFR